MDHVSVLLEHVDLLDRLDGLDVHLLERRLELLVVGARRLVDLLHLTAGGTLSTTHEYIYQPSILFQASIRLSAEHHAYRI